MILPITLNVHVNDDLCDAVEDYLRRSRYRHNAEDIDKELEALGNGTIRFSTLARVIVSRAGFDHCRDTTRGVEASNFRRKE